MDAVRCKPQRAVQLMSNSKPSKKCILLRACFTDISSLLPPVGGYNDFNKLMVYDVYTSSGNDYNNYTKPMLLWPPKYRPLPHALSPPCSYPSAPVSSPCSPPKTKQGGSLLNSLRRGGFGLGHYTLCTEIVLRKAKPASGMFLGT